MSKLSFRARALDANRTMEIIRSDENPDVLNEGAINRGQIQMSTGMEKEEEGEVHIAKAMAQTMFAANAIVVPIPESKILEKPKQDVKMTTFKMPKQYVRTHKWMLEDEKVPCYDMDTDDEQFLDAWNENSSNTKNKLTIDTVNFERIMDRVEMAQGDATDPKGMGETLGIDHRICKAVQDYAVTRIKELTLGSGTITPHLKQETNDVAASARDAYVAFRKRTERMHTRRGQKTTETSFINMVKLQRDLKRCKDLLEMVKKREVLKKEVLAEQIAVIKQRFELKDWNGAILEKILPKPKPQPTPLRLLSGMPWNAGVPAGPPGSAAEMQRQKKLASKRKRDEQYGPNGQKYKKRAGSHSDGSGPAYMSSDSESDWEDETSAVTESEWEHDDPFRLRRRFNMYYHAPLGDCPVRTSRAGQYSLAKRAQELTPPSGNPGLRGFCRRRVGRGGRIFIDRCRPDYDFFNELTRLTPEQEADLAEQDKRLRDMRAQFEARRRQAHELKQQQQQRMLQQMQQRRMSLNSSTGIHAGGGGGAMLVPGTSPQPGDQAGRAQRTPHLPQSNPYGRTYATPGGSSRSRGLSSSAPPLPGGTKAQVTGSPFVHGVPQHSPAAGGAGQATPKLAGPTPTSTPG
eukprot:gene942-22967_t